MKYKILSLNIGYFSGLNGSWADYIFKSWRYFFPSKKIVERSIKNLKKIITEEKPDIVCLMEARKSHMRHLLDGEYKFFDLETKYSPNGIAKRLPIFRDHCDCFISKGKVDFQKISFKNGTKKLVYGINIPGGTKLLFAHFALGKRTRAVQFDEIKDLIKKDGETIVGGDFNIFYGLQEVDNLIEKTGMKIMQKEPTFPAYNPKKALDLFLVSKNIFARSRVIKSDISDHLPVILEIDI